MLMIKLLMCVVVSHLSLLYSTSPQIICSYGVLTRYELNTCLFMTLEIYFFLFLKFFKEKYLLPEHRKFCVIKLGYENEY